MPSAVTPQFTINVYMYCILYNSYAVLRPTVSVPLVRSSNTGGGYDNGISQNLMSDSSITLEKDLIV